MNIIDQTSEKFSANRRAPEDEKQTSDCFFNFINNFDSPPQSIQSKISQYFKNKLKRFFSNFISPDFQRAQSSLERLRIEIDLAKRRSEDPWPNWLMTADRHFQLATTQADLGNLPVVWKALQESKRAMLAGETDETRLKNLASRLHREAKSKLSGWRMKAFHDVMSNKKGKLRADAGRNIENLQTAIWILDDNFNTTRYRIMFRRAQLTKLIFSLFLEMGAICVVSKFNAFDSEYISPAFVIGIISLGALGASLSVAQSLLRSDFAVRIPEQIAGTYTVWFRPAVGAAAACASIFLFRVSAQLSIGPNFHSIPMGVALVAGFSERFIVGGINALEEKRVGR